MGVLDKIDGVIYPVTSVGPLQVLYAVILRKH